RRSRREATSCGSRWTAHATALPNRTARATTGTKRSLPWCCELPVRVHLVAPEVALRGVVTAADGHPDVELEVCLVRIGARPGGEVGTVGVAGLGELGPVVGH